MLSIAGAGMGFITLYVSVLKVEQVLWLIVFILSSFVIQRYAERRYFLHGFVIGIVDYTVAAIVHIICFKTYGAHHKEILLFTDQNRALDPRVWLLLIELARGLFVSAAAGGFAFVIGRGMKRSYNR